MKARYVVYGIFDGDDCVYIGCTKNLQARWHAHLVLYPIEEYQYKVLELFKNRHKALEFEAKMVLRFYETVDNISHNPLKSPYSRFRYSFERYEHD